MPPKIAKYSNDQRCANCQKLLRYDRGQVKQISTILEAQEFSNLLRKHISISDCICGKCRSEAMKLKSTAMEGVETSDDSPTLEASTSQSSSSQPSQLGSDDSFHIRLRDEEEVEMVTMPFERVVATHSYCCVCFSKPESLIVVPFSARIQVFQLSRIFIPKNNRCCSQHLIHGRFFRDNIYKLQVFSHSSNIDKNELVLFLNELSSQSNKSILEKVDDYGMSEERIKALTGFTFVQIALIKDMLFSMRNSDNRTVYQALFVFLFKLKTGASNSVISSIFDLDYEQKVSDYCNSVLKSFEKDVSSKHFGVQACTRDDLINNHPK